MSYIGKSHTEEPDPRKLADMIRAVMADKRFSQRPWRYGQCNLTHEGDYANRTMARLLVNNIPTILRVLDPAEDALTAEYGPRIS